MLFAPKEHYKLVIDGSRRLIRASRKQARCDAPDERVVPEYDDLFYVLF
jgi:hypothetical protein